MEKYLEDPRHEQQGAPAAAHEGLLQQLCRRVRHQIEHTSQRSLSTHVEKGLAVTNTVHVRIAEPVTIPCAPSWPASVRRTDSTSCGSEKIAKSGSASARMDAKD